MNVTETTRVWYWKRLWSAIWWVFFWIILIIASIVLMWRNEWRTIKTTKWLDEWQKVTLQGSISPIDSSLEWKLVYIYGKADTQEILNDDVFKIQKNAIKLNREVSMYQWKEDQDTETHDNVWWSQTQTTTYSYDRIWEDTPINSSKFKEWGHENPSNWKFNSKFLIAWDVKIWDVKLTDSFVRQINNNEEILLDDTQSGVIKVIENISGAKIENNIIYVWNWTSENPEIGDMQISFSAVYPNDVSAIWQQQSNQLIEYTTENGLDISLLEYWTVSITKMYINAHNSNVLLSWMLRWWWLVWMFIWFTLLFWLISTLAKVLPFLGKIVDFWLWIISFFLTLIIWWWVIIVSWFFVRPLLSIILLIVIAWIIATIYFIKKKSIKKNTVTATIIDPKLG